MDARHVLTPVLCLALLLSSTVQATGVAAGGADTDYRSAMAKIDRMLDVARSLRERIDRSAFDPDALLDRLDYDADGIIRFVKQDIAFDQYPGVLRGAQGTLMSRAGNALDQSVLLARLLKDSGYDARIAGGHLTEAEAQQLLAEIVRPRSPEPPIAEDDAMSDALKTLGIPVGPGSGMIDPESTLVAEQFPGYEGVTDSIRLLEKALGDRLLAPSTETIESLVAEAQDYFWVQYREDASGPWQSVHPAFADAIDLQPQAETFFKDAVPPELQHKFRFQVFIEYAQHGQLHVRPISEPWTRPSANLNAVPMVFGNISDNMASDPRLAGSAAEYLKDARWFLPLFGDNAPPGGSYFDLRGTLIDPMGASNAAAGVFKSVGDLFAKATGELDSRAVPHLTAQWLEFTLIAPDGSERSYRRTSMDRIGPAARAAGQVPEDLGDPTAEEIGPLLQRQTFMVATGDTPRALAVDFALEKMIESRPLMEVLLRNAAGEQVDRRELERMLRTVPNYWTGHLALFDRFDLARSLPDVGAVYRSAPTVVIHRQGPNGEGRTLQGIDVVQNPRRAFVAQDGRLSVHAGGVLRAGIWETAVEGSLLPAGADRMNTATAFAEARAAGAPIKVVSNAAELAALRLPEDTVASMSTDLDAGNLLVVAEHASADGSGWWRVNPSTGETVGQMGDGRGSEILEGVALAISIGMMSISLLNCANAYNPETLADVGSSQAELVCCGLFSTVMFAFGCAIGVVHWTVGAVYDSLTSFMPYPSGCSKL